MKRRIGTRRLAVGIVSLAFLIPLSGACVREGDATRARITMAQPVAPPVVDESGEVRVVHHSVDLSLHLAPASLSGKGEIDVRGTDPQRPIRVIALDAKDLRVTEAATESGPLPFHHEGERLILELPRPTSNVVKLKLAWEAAASTTRKMPVFSKDEVWAGYRTSAWMPTRLGPGQNATLSLRITAPADTKVIASGRALGQTRAPDGRMVHAFSLERATPTFLYAFAVGPFEEAELNVDDVKLRALGPRGADLKSALAITAPMYRFLRQRTGIALPSAEYTQVFVHGDAAQEAASALEGTSGRDLRAFFARWVYASAPDL